MPAALQPARDPRIDAYIAAAADFARPILTHLRELVHRGCPRVTEALKWGMPSFEYCGILCGMAAFKKHCVFGFWKHDLLFAETRSAGAARAAGAKGTGASAKPASSRRSAAASRSASAPPAPREGAMGEFGRITRVADLPSRNVLLDLVRRAAALNEQGIKAPRTIRPKQKLVVPRDLAAALRDHPAAAATWEGFSYSKRKDYIEWLTEAKTQATRDRRLATTLAWLAEGKSRNWKYERC